MLHSTHTHTWPLGVCKWVDHHPRRPSTTALPPSSWAPRQRSLDPPRAQYGGASHTPPSLAEEPTPYVDWTRYHLQLLFVDRTDTGRARLAVGLFERVAEWNGYGRVLLAFSSGLDVTQHQPLRPPTAPNRRNAQQAQQQVHADQEDAPLQVDAWARTASLMSLAVRLGVRPKIFAAPPDQLVREDLDRFDLIIAIDDSLHEEIVARLLDRTDPYDSTGGSSLLSAELKRLLQPGLLGFNTDTTDDEKEQAGILPRVKRICRPSEEHSVTDTLQCCAGLVQFLIDSYPPDLPEYDPVD